MAMPPDRRGHAFGAALRIVRDSDASRPDHVGVASPVSSADDPGQPATPRALMGGRMQGWPPLRTANSFNWNDLQGISGGEGGIRTHVPVTRQDAFEAPPLRPLRYLSARVGLGVLGGPQPGRSALHADGTTTRGGRGQYPSSRPSATRAARRSGSSTRLDRSACACCRAGRKPPAQVGIGALLVYAARKVVRNRSGVESIKLGSRTRILNDWARSRWAVVPVAVKHGRNTPVVGMTMVGMRLARDRVPNDSSANGAPPRASAVAPAVRSRQIRTLKKGSPT